MRAAGPGMTTVPEAVTWAKFKGRFVSRKGGKLPTGKEQIQKAIWIQKGHMDFDGLKWVLKAVKPLSDDGENALSNVEFKDHLATACDGSRLHEYTLNAPEDFPNGIYRPFAVKKDLIFIFNEEKITYPSTDSIFPKAKSIKTLRVNMGKGALFDWAYALVIRAIAETQTVQVGLLEEMLGGGINWEVSIFKEMCLFTTSGKRGIIMAMKGV